jgi:hypothetical protein
LWAYLAPIVIANDGWALFITTARGRNHAKSMLDMPKMREDWFLEVLPVNVTGAMTEAAVVAQRVEYAGICILFNDAGGRWSARVRQDLRAGPGGRRLEARWQPIFERKQPAVAEVEEPGFPALDPASTRLEDAEPGLVKALEADLHKHLAASAHIRSASSPWTSFASNARVAIEPEAIARKASRRGSARTLPCPTFSWTAPASASRIWHPAQGPGYRRHDERPNGGCAASKPRADLSGQLSPATICRIYSPTT